MNLSVRWYKTHSAFPLDDGVRVVVRVIMMIDGHELPPLGCSCQGARVFQRNIPSPSRGRRWHGRYEGDMF